jgi:uncharacterized protein YeaO (DUF488 family)
MIPNAEGVSSSLPYRANPSSRVFEHVARDGAEELTLVYAARDAEHNEAIVLREALIQ